MNINFKKGDTVKVLAGKDRGKSGKVVAVDYKRGRVTVEGVNIRTRHQRARKAGQKGQKVQFPAGLDPSKLMLACPRCGKFTRIAHKTESSGKKMRMCKKCQGTFN
ncbi:MAG: 50S ribosomal protein L24 [Patescibacteria group bacterium]